MRFRLSALFLLLLVACEDELPRSGALLGQVVRLEDGVGYGPVAIAIYEVESLRVVATTFTDENGEFRIDKLLPGLYTPVVYDEERVVFHLERPHYEVRRGESAYARIPMTDVDFYSDTGVFLEGWILDEADDSPIEFALVEVSDLENGSDIGLWSFSEIEGRGGPLVSVTDAEGYYRIGPMPIVANPLGGSQTVPHVRIHHPLYIDAAMGPWDRFQMPTERTVRLRRGEDSGSVRGQLRYLLKDGSRLTEPAAGISVAIEWQGMGSIFPKLLISIPSSESDAEGFFEFEGLPPGRFVLRPSYLQDDGFVGEVDRVVHIPNPGDHVELAQPLAVAPALKLLSPADGALDPEPTLFDWEDYPEATSYLFQLRRGEDLGSYEFGVELESEYAVDQDARAFLSGGRTFRWTVIAYGQIGEVGRAERSFLLKR